MEHIYNWVDREISKIASERSETKNKAFEAWCLYKVHAGITLDDAFSFTDTLRGYLGGDGGLDGWYVDEQNKEFHLWQCKFPDTYATSDYNSAPYVELEGATKALIDPQKAAINGPKFVEVSVNLMNYIPHGYTLVLNVGIGGTINQNSVEKINKLFDIFQQEYVNKFAEYAEAKVVLEIWDLQKFEDHEEENLPSSETLEGTTVNFQISSTECIHMVTGDKTIPENWEVLVVSLSGRDIAEKAHLYKSKLFSLNVRYALLNKRIRKLRESLTSLETSSFFWLYNNGITIVCNDVKLIKDLTTGDFISVNITNPQIVNGCQTVTAFKFNRGKIVGNPSVLARIIKAPSDAVGKEQASKIAEFTNSQSQVLSRDLKTHDPIQMKIKNRFNLLSPAWFYEVKRGEWGTLSLSSRNKYKNEDGKYRIIDIESLGNSWRMVIGQPKEACVKKRDLFDNDDVYNSVYINIPAENYLFGFSLYNAYDAFWMGSNFDRIRDHSDEYMTDEILRRIVRQKGLIVAYSVALFSYYLKSEDKLTASDIILGMSIVTDFNVRAKKWNNIMIKSIYDLIMSIPINLSIKHAFTDSPEFRIDGQPTAFDRLKLGIVSTSSNLKIFNPNFKGPRNLFDI